MGDDVHKAVPQEMPLSAPALSARTHAAPSIGPPLFAGADGVPRAMTPVSEGRYLGEQGMYLAASGTLTQFNAIVAALLTAALSLSLPLGVKSLLGVALAAHALAGLLLCWAARPIANRDGSPRLTAEAMLAGSVTAYRRGWRATMLALALSVVALGVLSWQQLGVELLAALR